MTDPHAIYRPALDLLGRSEGTDIRRGYNETLAYGAYSGGDRNLTLMTLDEIDELQRAMLAHPRNKWNSSALGRYQIVRTTLREIRSKLRLTGRENFDPEMQDRMACYLLGKRGIDRWLAGQMTDSEMVNSLAKEWASLPTSKGVGHYDGQRAAVTVTEVLDALGRVRQLYRQARDQLNATKPKPTPPPQAPAKPASRGGVMAALLAIFKAIFGGRP